jgi:hypothetical protein
MSFMNYLQGELKDPLPVVLEDPDSVDPVSGVGWEAMKCGSM